MDDSQPSTSKANDDNRGNDGNSLQENVKVALNTLNRINRKAVKREAGNEREQGPAPTQHVDSESALRNNAAMLRQEEQALITFLTKLRSHQRTLVLEQQRLTNLYEEKVKEDEANTRQN